MYQFEIYGIPVAQKQTRLSKGRFYDPSSKEKSYIQWQIKPYCPKDLICEPLELTITFYLPLPKAAKGIKRRQMINGALLPDKKPDIDNLAYLITNALKGFVYDDDKRVCSQRLKKLYGLEPKTVICVRPIFTGEVLGLSMEEENNEDCI